MTTQFQHHHRNAAKGEGKLSMILKRLLLLAVLTAPVPSLAQTVVDESGRSIGTAGVAELVAILKDSLFDPPSTQLRSLRRTSRGYCGELKTASRSGPALGFHRFAVDLRKRELFIEGPAEEVESSRSNRAGIQGVCGRS
jgi:hypothetical protein